MTQIVSCQIHQDRHHSVNTQFPSFIFQPEHRSMEVLENSLRPQRNSFKVKGSGCLWDARVRGPLLHKDLFLPASSSLTQLLHGSYQPSCNCSTPTCLASARPTRTSLCRFTPSHLRARPVRIHVPPPPGPCAPSSSEFPVHC